MEFAKEISVKITRGAVTILGEAPKHSLVLVNTETGKAHALVAKVRNTNEVLATKAMLRAVYAEARVNAEIAAMHNTVKRRIPSVTAKVMRANLALLTDKNGAILGNFAMSFANRPTKLNGKSQLFGDFIKPDPKSDVYRLYINEGRSWDEEELATALTAEAKWCLSRYDRFRAVDAAMPGTLNKVRLATGAEATSPAPQSPTVPRRAIANPRCDDFISFVKLNEQSDSIKDFLCHTLDSYKSVCALGQDDLAMEELIKVIDLITESYITDRYDDMILVMRSKQSTPEACSYNLNAIFEIYTDVVKSPRQQLAADNRYLPNYK